MLINAPKGATPETAKATAGRSLQSDSNVVA